MSSSPETSSPKARLHVSAHLPPTISFSSAEEPHIEVHIRLEYSEPIILGWQRSRLNPIWGQTLLTIRDTRYKEREYVPWIELCHPHGGIPSPPPVAAENKDAFLGLRPGDTKMVEVPFRPYDKPYPFSQRREDRYDGIFPFGMQHLAIGEEYEIGFREGEERYMVGDLEEMVGREQGTPWKYGGAAELVVGEKCCFRVEA